MIVPEGATGGDVRIALLVTLLAQTAMSLLAASVAVLAPAIAAGRGWNLALIALYAPLLYVAAFSINFTVPWLLNRLGGIGLALGSIVLGALGLSCLLFPLPLMAVLAALLIGMGYGAMTPASSHVLGPRTTATNAGTIMSIKQVGVPMGAMLAGVVLPDLVASYGWERTVGDIIIVSAIIAVSLLPTILWLSGSESKSLSRYRPLDPIRYLLSIPGMAGVLTAALVYTGVQLCLRSLLTTYLVKDVGLGLSAAGYALSVSQGAGMFGQVLWAWLSDRVMTPRAVLSVVGAVICIGALAVSGFSPQWSVGAIMVVAALLGFSVAGFLPVVLGEVARHAAPGQVGALTSGANIFVIAGAFSGPLAFGGISSVLSYKAAFVVLAAAAAIMATGLLTAQPDSRPLTLRSDKNLP